MQTMAGAEPFHASGSGQRGRTGVLLVHGLTATPQNMRPLAVPLAERGYAVSAPLLPGHGTTWREMNRTTYADWYTAVERASAHLAEEVDRLVVAGISLGGALVTDLAAQRRDLVAGLVLVNPAFTAQDPRLRLIPLVKHLLPSLPGLADDIRRHGPPRELAYDRTPLKALHSFVRQWPRLQAALPRVTEPVLLARSAHDRVVPPLSAEIFLERVGSSDVTQVWLPDSGHVATLDHDAGLLLEATTAFVERVGSS